MGMITRRGVLPTVLRRYGDLETSRMSRLLPAMSRSATGGGGSCLKFLQKYHADDILDTLLAVVYNQNTTANGKANFLNTSF